MIQELITAIYYLSFCLNKITLIWQLLYKIYNQCFCKACLFKFTTVFFLLADILYIFKQKTREVKLYKVTCDELNGILSITRVCEIKI